MGQRDEKDKVKSRKEKLASYFYDLSKLIFTGLVLGGIVPVFTDGTYTPKLWILIAGSIATYITAFFANRILKY
ncbi:DUF6722 family protein [Prevotella sp.]